MFLFMKTSGSLYLLKEDHVRMTATQAKGGDAGVAKYDACGGIMTQWDDVAAGRESVQRREATIDVHATEGASEACSMDQKAAALRPEGTTQRQPNARSE
jgi:hypothetical protein